MEKETKIMITAHISVLILIVSALLYLSVSLYNGVEEAIWQKSYSQEREDAHIFCIIDADMRGVKVIDREYYCLDYNDDLIPIGELKHDVLEVIHDE